MYAQFLSNTTDATEPLVKGYDADSINRIAKEMGIPRKKLDVEAHRHSLRQTLHTFIDGDRTNVPMAAQELLNWIEFDRHSNHKHTFKLLREQDLWPNDIQDKLQQFFEKKREWRHETQRELKDAAKAQGGNLRKPEYQTITYERYQSFEEVDKQLKEKIFELATSILGKPLKNSGRDYVEFKSPVGKVSVAMRGAKVGVYTNFRSGVKGGPLKLIEDQMGLASTRDALKWASEWLGGNPLVIEHRVVEKQQNEAKFSTWTPITPVPKEVAPPDIEGNKYLNYMLRDGNKETGRYAYKDEAGNLKGYVFRIEKADGSKITPPLAYCENEKGFKAWKWMGFEKENKTPYGIEKLAQNPTKPILVVEGEKTADAAQKLLPEYNVLTWGGGAGNVGKTNWECLKGREVVVWPDYDYDQGGQIAAEKLQKIVTQLNKEAGIEGCVGIVKLPPLTPGQTPLLPNKWDLADKLPESWTLDTVKEMIREANPEKQLERSISQHGIEEQNAHAPSKTYDFEEKQTLAYLKQEIRTENHDWLDESDVKRLITLATLDPKEALKEWQYVTDDYSFDPYKFNSALADNINSKDELLSTLNYLKEEITLEKHEWLSSEDCEMLLNEAEKDPLKTLSKWQSITDDYSFIPGGIESLRADQLKAYEMLQAVQNIISDEKLNEWHRIFKDSPQEVIEKCQPILDQKQARMDESTYRTKLEVACRRYMDISDKYQSLPWGDPQKETLDRNLNEIADKYLHDEKFVKIISSSGNDAAIRRMNAEIQQRDHSISKGMSLER